MTTARLVCPWCSFYEFFVKSEGVAQLFLNGSRVSQFETEQHSSFVCACCGAESDPGDLVIEDEFPVHHQVKGGNS